MNRGTSPGRTLPRPAPPDPVPDSPALRPLVVFTASALSVGGGLLGLSTVIDPGAPFILAAVLLGLAVPALVLTHREAGPAGVRRLLRDVVRLPSRWWWLPASAFMLPGLAWATAAVAGGAKPLNGSLLGLYLADLLVGAVLINIWEEMAWTGFVQRRAIARWQLLGGSLVTAFLFAGIHLPLTLSGSAAWGEAVRNVLILGCVAVGLRLLIARVDAWSGRSLLTIGVLHSSFNATETLLDPAYDWIRVATMVVVGFALLAFGGRRPDQPGVDRL